MTTLIRSTTPCSNLSNPFKPIARNLCLTPTCGAKMWVSPPRKKNTDRETLGPLLDSLRLIKATKIQDPDLAFRVNVQPILKKEVNSNVMRGRLFLPHQVPKDEDQAKDVIAVIVREGSSEYNIAKSLGVDYVGGQSLVDSIVDGHVNPTKLLCHPDQLPLLVRDSKVARALGPRGLIPSEKRGTVSEDITKLIQDARGALDWMMDSTSGLVVADLGKLSMNVQDVEQNVMALVDTVAEIAQGGRGAPRNFKSGRPTKRPGIKRVFLTVEGAPQITVT